MNVRVPRRFSRVRLCVTLWTVACQAPVSMGFPRKEYWSGLPLPSPIRRLKTKTKKHVNGCLDEIWNLESNDHQGETKTKKESLGRARPPPPRPSPPKTHSQRGWRGEPQRWENPSSSPGNLLLCPRSPSLVHFGL